jgi:hypothetical protein
MSRILGVVVLLASSAVFAAPPRTMIHPVHIEPGSVPKIVNSHTLYLNNCQPGGCLVHTGNTDARTLTSDIGQGNLSPYGGSAASWTSVFNCVKMVMAPFNITVTDTKPTDADYFEVLIAGSSGQLGLPPSVLGVADYPCQAPQNCGATYIPDALVFDFANDAGGDVNLICGTAAQEIAHAWTLDHAVPQTDPMTYNNYASPLHFQDNAACGSDCLYQCSSGTGMCNSFDVPCSSDRHTCMSSGQAVQNEVQIISALFGPAGAAVPTVKITSPANGSAVQAGGEVDVTCTSPDGVEEVDFNFDGAAVSTLTAAPFKFQVPTSASDGTHTIQVLCATNKQASAVATEMVVVGAKCTDASSCPMNDLCYEMACVAGPNATGGIGMPCTKNGDCVSNLCANDGSMAACVVPCDTSADHCPDGFGCVATGGTANTNGVCFPGAPHSGGGGGCCQTGGSPAGPLLLGGIAALWITRRKRVISRG